MSEAEGGPAHRVSRALHNARLTLAAASADDIVILTDKHGLSGSFVGMMAGRNQHRPTVVRTDALFAWPDGVVRRTLKRTYIRAAMAAVDAMVVWAPDTIDRYHAAFGLPREQFVVVPFHHTLTGFEASDTTRARYLFSGGDSARDYPTLLRAVDGLDIDVVIATRLNLPSVGVPKNVTIKPTSRVEFRKLMAGAEFVVFPLKMQGLRTSGQQSYLNAMAMAKAVIVTDTRDAPYYIEDGRTGMLTPPGDVRLLRDAIKTLLGSRERIVMLGEAGREAARPLDQEYTWSRILAVARRAHEARLAQR